MDQTYVALDLEFTGLDPQQDEIIELALVKFRGAEVLETFTSLVKPQRTVPYKIQQLVGIPPEELTTAPTLRSLLGRVLMFVQNLPLVAHSIDTDLTFLRQGGMRLNNLAIDSFELATIVMPEARIYSLANLCELLDISLEENHRALPDAMATKDLFLALWERLYAWDLPVIEEIAELSQASQWQLRALFRQILAERHAQEGESLLNQPPAQPRAQRPRAQVEDLTPLEPTPAITPVDTPALTEMISPGGVFARRFPGYEHRPEQVEMLEAVSEALNIPCHLIVEAGTGIGKSVAYLLPAVHFAMQNGRRVVISSNTINLQDQLVQKDIPDLRDILGLPFRAAVLKGRSNYLCLRRLRLFRRNRALTADEARVLAKVLYWLPHTDTGDRAELTLVATENAVWPQIQADSLSCSGDLCPFHQSGRCFFFQARSRAERAHLLVVNHALLLSDLALESRVLPEYRYLILDEAHHLEDRATEQFSISVASRDVYAFLTSLSHQGTETAAGALAMIPRLYQEAELSPATQAAIGRTLQEIRTRVEEAMPRLRDLFGVLAQFLIDHDGGQRGQDGYDVRISLTSSLRTQPGWSQVEIAWDDLSVPLHQVLQGLRKLLTQLDAAIEQENATREELSQEIKASLQQGSEMMSGLERILMEPEEEEIYWIGYAKRNDEVTLNSAPLHVGPTLATQLFEQKDCVILTSATLRTANSFRYIEQRLGIEDPTEVALGSPFDYKSAVLLYVPKDMPEPYQPYYQRSVERALVDLCIATEGRTLVLFTSNSQLNATYRAIQGPLEREGIMVLAQGIDGSRRQLLQSFRTASRAVLLGTRSFWEGVDVAGQALSCLVITRLPFAVPTDPVVAARAATFDDPFQEYSLPDAILRLRQGFGRLIRTKDDFGLVVVLDTRILTKAYGKTVLRSLPPCTARQGPLEALPDVARRWLNPSNRGS